MSVTPLTVLVVDDESLIRWSVAEVLSAHGYTVLEAEDARGALRTLDERRGMIDVVLLDYHLPDSSDLGLLRRVHDCAPEVAVVMLTGLTSDAWVAQALAHGAEDILSKPFTLGLLPDVLARAVRRHGGTRRAMPARALDV